jgi:hypothetical protein
MGCSLDNFLETILKLVSESGKVVSYLFLHVEVKVTFTLRVVVDHCVNKSFSVAFIEKVFDNWEAIIE